jgi:hypothetical protein
MISVKKKVYYMAETNHTSRRDNLTAAPKPVTDQTSIAPSETTELERRVLAHELILQTLIAHMAETEPKFIARLTDTFCVPQQMTRCEHDYTDTASYAEQFIRTVVRLGIKPARKPSGSVGSGQSEVVATSGDPTEELPLTALPRFQISQAGGVWRVTKDGGFYGDFSKEQHALTAVELDR